MKAIFALVLAGFATLVAPALRAAGFAENWGGADGER